jgi:hypothetical protein
MYQDFDASEFGSEFDYLNSETSQQFEQQNQAKKSEVTNIERFWTLTGNWGKFGSYFSAGLSASLIIRAIPALIPVAVILIPAAGLGVAVYSLAVDGTEKLRSQLILIAVGTALIAGNWDAWQAWIIANSQMLILSLALIVITVGFVAAQIWSKLSNVSK